MVRGMSLARHLPPGYVVTYPNREKPASKATKSVVIGVLLLSVLLMLIVTFGGWSKLEGLIPVNLVWCLIYLVCAYYIARWARGLLPIVAALAALMLTFTVISVTGVAGMTWSDRIGPGYAPVQTIFGGAGLSPHTLNALIVLIAIVQGVLIVVAMQAFSQAWNIEYEVPEQVLAQ
jgi:hypothetical protein